ncbi:ribonuclease [Croceibacterium ferulae]|uniref:ribonuclease n=1 Tax=Croceibacterium ferulae TaxID=1854641 RepID=UPI000EB46771|nr:ribonuclease [Croceibacterium ferulae]
MAEWLVEQGIAEERAILWDGADILAAAWQWSDGLRAGMVADAVLLRRAKGATRGTARFANGEEALVDRLPAGAVEGAPIRLEVTRPSIGERGRTKLARARRSDLSTIVPTLAQQLGGRPDHRFPAGPWDELMAEAFAGEVGFAGGSLVLHATPAMVLVDVDGTVPPPALAQAAVAPLAAALRRLDIGGSVGVDMPTLAQKTDRRMVDDALETVLAGWPHERTAMNGFGFVQIVSRFTRVSLLHRAQLHPAESAARWLLRRAEVAAETGIAGGMVALACHPMVAEQLRADWLAELARRTGREVRVTSDARLAIAAPHAQIIAR